MIRHLVLACDYDGTLATHGKVGESTIAALERVRESGRKLVLVTGRELGDLERVFDRFDIFDAVVAENGALLYLPATREELPLGEPPPEAFVQTLRDRGVTPLSVGRVIVASWEPNETAVLEVIRELGVERQIIFNKGAVMVLPAGVNKATGLAAALQHMCISPHNVAAIGDAENDHALLSMAECGAAVANALPVLKERADYVCERDHGAGVEEFVERLLSDDLASLCLTRHDIRLGVAEDGRELRVQPHSSGVLIAGSSGSGKSTITRGLIERLRDAGYQVCLVDPEGDYEFEGIVRVGDPGHPPTEDTALQLLEEPAESATINLLGIPLADRPGFFARLVPRIQELRARSGHPHCLVIDEAHHMLPQAWERAEGVLPQDLSGVIMITVHPDRLSPAVLSSVRTVIGVGAAGHEVVLAVADALGESPPRTPQPRPDEGFAIVWMRDDGAAPVRFKPEEPRSEQHRHKRKYAQGELGEDKSFYFRGPEGKLNIRAQNLVLFAQIAEGVDEATWQHHLQRGHYSRWFRESIKDDELAGVAEDLERERTSPGESRRRLLDAIRERYTAPA